ncbi:MAG: Sec-independent protein translocase protein TatB [Acidimicrobiales bacterium]
MFNIGGGEILVILLLALIVLGPQKLPDAARRVGSMMGELKRMSAGFQNELRNALEEPEPRPKGPQAQVAPPGGDDSPKAEHAAPGDAPAPAGAEPPGDGDAESPDARAS